MGREISVSAAKEGGINIGPPERSYTMISRVLGHLSDNGTLKRVYQASTTASELRTGVQKAALSCAAHLFNDTYFYDSHVYRALDVQMADAVELYEEFGTEHAMSLATALSTAQWDGTIEYKAKFACLRVVVEFFTRPRDGGVLPDDPESVREFLDDMRSHRVNNGNAEKDPTHLVTDRYGRAFYEHLIGVKHIFWSRVGARVESLYLYHEFGWVYRAVFNVQAIHEGLINCFNLFLKEKVGREAFEEMLKLMDIGSVRLNERLSKLLNAKLDPYLAILHVDAHDAEEELAKGAAFLGRLRTAARRTMQFKDGTRIVFSDESGAPGQPAVTFLRLGNFEAEPDGDYPPLTLLDERLDSLLPEYKSLAALRSLDVSEMVAFYEAVFGDSAGAFINLLAGNIAARKESQKWLIILYNECRDLGKTFVLYLANALATPTIMMKVAAGHNKIYLDPSPKSDDAIKTLTLYGRSQFLMFDDLTKRSIEFSAIKTFQSAYREIKLPDTRGTLDSVLVQPMFAVSTNVADPADLFRTRPETEDRKLILLVEARDPPPDMKRDPRVTRMQADLTSSLGKEQRLRALFIAMIVQTLDQPRPEVTKYTLTDYYAARPDLLADEVHAMRIDDDEPAVGTASPPAERLEMLKAFMEAHFIKTEHAKASWEQFGMNNITFMVSTTDRRGPFLMEEFRAFASRTAPAGGLAYSNVADMGGDLKLLGYTVKPKLHPSGQTPGLVGNPSNVVFVRPRPLGTVNAAGQAPLSKRPRSAAGA